MKRRTEGGSGATTETVDPEKERNSVVRRRGSAEGGAPAQRSERSSDGPQRRERHSAERVFGTRARGKGDNEVIRGNVFRSARAQEQHKMARESLQRGDNRVEMEVVHTPRRRNNRSPRKGGANPPAAATRPAPKSATPSAPSPKAAAGDAERRPPAPPEAKKEQQPEASDAEAIDDPVERARRALMEL